MEEDPQPDDLPSAKPRPAARMGPLQFGFPWILAFTLVCGVLFAAVAGAGDHLLVVAGASAASFVLALGAVMLRVLAVERTQALEARERCKQLAWATPHRGRPEGHGRVEPME